MKAKHLVIDSCALIKNADIASMADNMYTCPDVVSEVKDRTLRRLLSVLPYDLHVLTPSPETVQKIVASSKVTGDYRSLSHTDIQVLALTYELAQRHGEAPNDVITTNTDTIEMGGSVQADLAIPGFYLPKKNNKSKQSPNSIDCDVIDDAGNKDDDVTSDVTKSVEDLKLEEEEESETEEGDDSNVEDEGSEEWISPGNNGNGGWITPATLREVNKKHAAEEVSVGCITRDFAMQNVLRKLNLHIVSVDGKIIGSLRSYVLRCHACFEVTKVMTKAFCPKCGNKTLKRVPVELGPNGTMKMFFSRNPKVLNPKGLQHSLPLPRGGKHANNPVLVEDQRVPHNRLPRKALARTDVWSENYECDKSPFASRDVDSKAFRLGLRPSLNKKGGSGTRFIKRK